MTAQDLTHDNVVADDPVSPVNKGAMVTDPVVIEPPPSEPHEQQRRFGRRAFLFASMPVVVGGIGAAAMLRSQSGGRGGPAAPQRAVSTTTIERGTLAGSVRVPGTLAYADPRDLIAGGDGIVTMLPHIGDLVERGDMLTVVAGSTSVLMYGDLPAWRDLEQGMPDGWDVYQLEENLKMMGHLNGDPDGHFDADTRRAIEVWQHASGFPKTGRIPLGVVSFMPGPRRISELKVAIGSSVTVTTPALATTAPERQVTADVALADQTLVTAGAAVDIELTDGSTTKGVVTDIGVPEVRDGANGGTTTIIPIVVRLRDPESAGVLQQANVSLLIDKTVATDVLHVPVSALIALDERRFAVQVQQADGSIVTREVTTGLFAAGNVEVSGDGIAEGQQVVVPS